MWVQSEFDGDEDSRLMWLQHDCYWSTLRFIFVQIRDASSIELPIEIDHRDFQRSHDLLAACFRYDFKQNSGYTKLSADDILGKTIETEQQKRDQEIVSEWLNWLQNVVASEPISRSYKRALNTLPPQIIPEA